MSSEPLQGESCVEAVPTAPADRPRYGQLTYTSFDRPALGRGPARGGWQIKDVLGELDDAEQDAARAGISTRLETVIAPPAFPTQDDIDNRPRRLHYGPLLDDAVAYWHSVPAGADASGRPGNVFAHVLIDRAPNMPPPRRPISLWRSDGWLTPYGAEAVAGAELSTGAGFDAGVLDQWRLVQFLLDPDVWRIGVMCVLLDAVHHAMYHGGTVVLGVEHPDRGAMWIGVVSALMSATASARFFFSTFERRPSADDLAALDVHVVCVPVEDLESMELPAQFVVLSEAEAPSLGEYGVEPHRTERGLEVEVTEWSVLAQTVLLDPAAARDALKDLDAVTDSPSSDHEIAWPLATVVDREVREGKVRFADAFAEAGRVLERNLPHAPWRQSAVTGASSTSLPETAAVGPAASASAMVSTLSAIVAMPTSTPDLQEERWRRLLEFIPHNPGWSAEHAVGAGEFGVRIAEPSVRLLDAVETVANDFLVQCDARNQLFESVATHAFEKELLRFLDLVMAAGLVDDRTEVCVQRLLEDAIVPQLLDPAPAPTFVSHVGRIADPLRALLRDCLTSGDVHNFLSRRPLGARLTPAVIEWVLPSAGVDGRIRVPEAAVEEPAVALAADLVVRLVDTGEQADDGPWAAWVPLALWRVLWESREPKFAPTDATRLLRSEFLPAHDLDYLAQRFPGIIPARFLRYAFTSDVVDDTSSTTLAEMVCTLDAPRQTMSPIAAPDRVRDNNARSWADLRLTDSWNYRDHGDLHRRVQSTRPALIDFCRMAPDEVASLSPAIRDRLAVLLLATRWSRDRRGAAFVPYFGQVQVAALRESVMEPGGYVSTNVSNLARSGIIDAAWLTASVVLLTELPSSTRQPGPDLLNLLGFAGKGGSGLLEGLVRDALSGLRADAQGPTRIVHLLQDELERRDRTPAAVVRAPAVVGDFAANAQEWFDYLTAPREAAARLGMLARLRKDKS